ncbi:MAG: hypothetical protein NVS9B12_06370 [Vulcanimicrobiaceae bacterium]
MRFIVLGLLAVLAACSSGGENSGGVLKAASVAQQPAQTALSQTPAARGVQGMQRAITSNALTDRLLYVASHQNNEIDAYDLSVAGNPLVQTITQGVSAPAGIYVGAHGTLYVANQTGSVTEYSPGSLTPSRTITAGLFAPQSVIADAHEVLYVSNRNSGNTPGSIQEYLKAQTTPVKTVTGQPIQGPSQMAIDAGGNIFVSDNSTGAYYLPYGAAAPQALNLAIGGSSGIAIDPQSGTLFVSTVSSIQKFRPFIVSPFTSFNVSAANAIAISGKDLFVPNFLSNSVDVYSLSGSVPGSSIAVAPMPNGVAVKPAGIL